MNVRIKINSKETNVKNEFEKKMRKGYRKILRVSILQVTWRKVRYKGKPKWQSESIVVGKWVIHNCVNYGITTAEG